MLINRAAELGANDLTGEEKVRDIADKLGMKPYDLLPKLDPKLVHE